MKKTFMLILVIAFAVLVATANPLKEIEKIQNVLQEYYSAVEKFDYKAIPTFCTADFTGFEEGNYYHKIEDYISLLKKYEGSFTNVKINFVKTEVSGNMAFSIVELEARSSTNRDNIIKAYESHILKKVDNNWLIHYYHVSHLNTPNNNQ